jgi:hypothetical protein
VDDAGKLQTRRDVYATDARTLAAIRSDRVMIENAPPERKQEQEVASASSGKRRNAAPAPSSPGSFFASLFGRPMPPPGRVVRPARGIYYR